MLELPCQKSLNVSLNCLHRNDECHHLAKRTKCNVPTIFYTGLCLYTELCEQLRTIKHFIQKSQHAHYFLEFYVCSFVCNRVYLFEKWKNHYVSRLIYKFLLYFKNPVSIGSHSCRFISKELFKFLYYFKIPLLLSKYKCIFHIEAL